MEENQQFNIETKSNEGLDDVVRCPNCGSTQIEFVTYQASQGYDAAQGCCGILMCGPLGALCGVGPKEKPKTVRKCKKCGHEF